MGRSTSEPPQLGDNARRSEPTDLADHRPWLRAVVYARLGSWDGVDDVLQEVALAAVQHNPPKGTRFKPWLRRVAIRQALLYRRRTGRQRRRDEAVAQLLTETDGNGRLLSPDPLEWLLQQEQSYLVQKALEQLPAVDAEILLLKYGEDWSYDQIAEHLGTTAPAVQARLHRARMRLRRVLTGLSRASLGKGNE
ncbi:MAG: RNA polymerase sigma factor [Thermoguttaceae bacterium]|nr:RNA polymerase sigma factor [Thermoguttaceae bacterium]MDW8079596.1 RNA polymerase sigma factor [Thermoguttaceae bacterium]